MLTCNFQFKLNPSKRQVAKIEKYFATSRQVWNYALTERKDWINSGKCNLNKCSLEKQYIIPADTPYPCYKIQAVALTQARKVCPNLKDVNAQVLQQVLRQLDRAFAEMKSLQKGLPRFKSKFGLDYFLIISGYRLVKKSKFFNKLHRKLKLLPRRLMNKKLGSNNRHKLNQKIAQLHQKASETRRDFHYKLAHRLCDENGMIFVEDIDFRNGSKNMLCKHNLGAGFGQFFDILSHVCWKRDVYFAKVDKNYTSQICPYCGVHTGKKKLSERIHKCPECRFSCNRDLAASLVIRNRGLNAVGQPVWENACGDSLSGFDRQIKLDKNR